LNAGPIRQVKFEYVAIKKEQGEKRNVLRRRSYIAIDRQVRKVFVDLVGAHVPGMSFLMKENEAFDVLAIGFLGGRT
jgi:hypothetical protein